MLTWNAPIAPMTRGPHEVRGLRGVPLEEFYILRVLNIKSERELLEEALGYIYYYNKVREHSSLGYKTPYQYLREQLPEVDENIRFVVPILLDKVAVALGPWSGYNVLAQHHASFISRSISPHCIASPSVLQPAGMEGVE